MICIAFSALAAAFASGLHAEGRVPTYASGSSYVASITEGVRIIFVNCQVLVICLALIYSWATAQMALSLLAGFTRLELRLNADAYGWIEAMWGIGGLSGGVTPICLSRKAFDRNLLRFGVLLLPAATAGFSVAQGFWTTLLLHGLMGTAFAINLAICNSHILRAVDARAIGRARNNLQAAIEAVGVGVFLSPIFYRDASVREVYLGFSLILASAAAMLLVAHHRAERHAKALPSVAPCERRDKPIPQTPCAFD
ncbi:hypothetical protein [Ensifer aridi]|uniref:hypothetical protein n=1 Tax=Ensifer aridi TaxID=1708715 RepID=UPI0009BDDE6F|nr:hypothetical protein [Ensifer aridi]